MLKDWNKKGENMKITGLVKLRVVVTILFIFSLTQLILVFAQPDYTNEYYDAYNTLTYDEQRAVEKYSNNLPEEDPSFNILLGFIFYANIVGLGILSYKLWNIKEI